MASRTSNQAERFRRSYKMQIVRAEIKTANVVYLKKNSYPDFQHIRVARRPN